ncbi:MAG TPA: chemotaxis protein CheW [Burkholderiaceae bacterium]|nr:chemotaxis protein CheW [Burkholderiaceae bacterium]
MGEVTNQGLQPGEFDLKQLHLVFFEEAAENLANMEALLLTMDLERPADEQLNAVFRVAHSIKGGAATFGLLDVTAVTHELETLLERVRRHELALDRATVDVLLEAGDVVRAQLARHQGRTKSAPPADELIGRIRQLAAGARAAAARPIEPAASVVAADASARPEAVRRLKIRVGPLKDGSVAQGLAELFRDLPSLGALAPADDGALSAEGYRYFFVTTSALDFELTELFSFHVGREQILIEEQPAPPRAPPPGTAMGANHVPKDADGQANGYALFVDRKTLAAAQASVETKTSVAGEGAGGATHKDLLAVTLNKETENKPQPQREGVESLHTLRVSVERVDQLINLVGELVTTQAMLTQQVKDLDAGKFHHLQSGVSELERNTRLLQEAAMSIRMIPMSFVFNRFPRMIRDLAGKLGKRIELKTVGEATELDKGLIERIIDPLTHLVRNSVDHGLETPERRLAEGKPETGTITLIASQQGGSVLIEVRDDGQGLQRGRILDAARQRALAVREDMTDPEVWALVWEAGFSTADRVSDLSGRGMGMDVVRRNITALGGTVELTSTEGRGTRVCVRLPLTLAIMDGMSVGVGDETYIVPLASVVESFRIEAGMIQTVGGSGRVVKVRDDYMPVLSLAEQFGVRGRAGDFPDKASPQILVVLETEGTRVAAIVDELLGQHQVVVKNLETNYRRVRDISGATILGDGHVALIIDVAGLIKRTRH